MNDAGFRLAVLNPGARDPELSFDDGAGDPAAAGHPPVNHHGYAACTGGAFYDRVGRAIASGRPVMMLLRRDLAASQRALRRLKAAGCTVAVAFKEAGAAQVAARISHPGQWRLLRDTLAAADGAIAPTRGLTTFFENASPGKPVAFIPTPYPVEDERWNFEAPAAERRGIFIGTRQFDVPSRQHLAALLAARELHRSTGEPVTVLNGDGRVGARLLRELGFESDGPLRMVEAPLPYTAYLREMARHKLVFQLDASGVPGQVAGDALLCRMPCVGGDGAIEQAVFSGLCGSGRKVGELVEIAARLLRDPIAWTQARDVAIDRAKVEVGYVPVAKKLAEFFGRLGAENGKSVA